MTFYLVYHYVSKRLFVKDIKMGNNVNVSIYEIEAIYKCKIFQFYLYFPKNTILERNTHLSYCCLN